MEHAIYDFESRMLRRFLDGLAAHLAPGGEGWLILSDIAEHLGLRTRDELQAWIEKAGLKVLGKIDIKPNTRAPPMRPMRCIRRVRLRLLPCGGFRHGIS